MRKTTLFLLFMCLGLTSCKKEDPNPHLKDPIYTDILAKEGAVTAAVAEIEKQLAEAQKELSEAKPQTADIKRARNKIYDSQNRLARAKQEHKYILIKKMEREAEAKRSYRIAFKKGLEWPDPKEFEAYREAEKLRQTEGTWSVKKRLELNQENVPRGTTGH